MINSFVDWLVNLITVIGYPGVMFSMFVESFFAPIPSEIILPFSGFVASSGVLNIYLVIILASFAAYLGSLPFYLIGRWGKDKVDIFLRKYGKYMFIKEGDLDKGYDIFSKHGNKMVFFGRLIPIIRTVISFPAGIANMNFGLFSTYTFAGTLVWSSVLVGAGYLLGDNWGSIAGYVSKYEKIILIVLIVIILLFAARGIRNIIKEKRAK
jgi:membrane protein DedA with SNARE-associated domain